MSNIKYSDKQHLEFGGAIGATVLVFGLPAAIMVINIACNKVFIALCTITLFVGFYRATQLC